MAPPNAKRSGFSRRAQYSIFTGYVLAGIGALIGGALLIVSLRDPHFFSGPRMDAMDAIAPVGKAGAVVRTESKGLLGTVQGYLSAGSRNARLREEVELARIRLAEADAVRNENQRLKALLKLTEEEIKPVAIARLIGGTSSSTRRFAFLSAGKKDGVAPGMPVRSARGLVGRVLEVGDSSARVLLLTDSESMVPVRRAKDNVIAFAEGRADGSLRLRLVNLGINPIREGDIFVTSGAGGLYRPGIAVAMATRLNKDGAIARLLSDPAATDFVLVDPIWKSVAVQAVTAPPGTPLP